MEATKENPKEAAQAWKAEGGDDQNTEWNKVNHRKNISAHRSQADLHAFGGNKKRNPNPKTSILVRMSMSFFITNFPHAVTYKDLWNRCSVWGTVVDVFIANRLSKAGKRFTFVCFIKVSDADLLLKNLNSMWFAKYKVFADVVKFNRSFNNRKEIDNNVPAVTVVPANPKPSESIKVPNQKTYAAAVSGSTSCSYVHVKKRIVKVSPISETIHDDTLSLLIKVIEPAAIPFVRQWFHTEGFFDINVTYIGGQWLFVTFASSEAKDLFMANDSLKSRFEAIITPSNSFVPDEHLVWVEVHGIPKGAWHNKTLMDITEIWGKSVFFDGDWDSACSVAKVCLLSQSKSFILEELTISLEDKPYSVWLKELAPWEPKILSPNYVSSDNV